ncbi:MULTISPECIES: hypothetical protein [unclassified Listeria]|uniref:hypothetical protein n=1 Tax=unclassified Listeria TaxID=2642072 RepID=UPI000B59533D|nr:MULTISPECIES: hypothetical protein [unclassified Listeria]
MIDVNDGRFVISNTLILYPGYKFDDFKRSKYYNGQDGIRIIYLDDKQIIDGKKYHVSLFFRNNKIYLVSLINCDSEISESKEEERKMLHDRILEENNILSGHQYEWGKIVSEYDARSNISSIDIYYK